MGLESVSRPRDTHFVAMSGFQVGFLNDCFVVSLEILVGGGCYFFGFYYILK